jgi:hypothetical protein
VETPRKFITAKLSIHIISTDEDPGLRIESFAVIHLRGVSTNKKYYIRTCFALYGAGGACCSYEHGTTACQDESYHENVFLTIKDRLNKHYTVIGIKFTQFNFEMSF